MTKGQAERYRDELGKLGRSGHVERLVNDRLNGYALKVGERYLTGVEEASHLVAELKQKTEAR